MAAQYTRHISLISCFLPLTICLSYLLELSPLLLTHSNCHYRKSKWLISVLGFTENSVYFNNFPYSSHYLYFLPPLLFTTLACCCHTNYTHAQTSCLLCCTHCLPVLHTYTVYHPQCLFRVPPMPLLPAATHSSHTHASCLLYCVCPCFLPLSLCICTLPLPPHHAHLQPAAAHLTHILPPILLAQVLPMPLPLCMLLPPPLATCIFHIYMTSAFACICLLPPAPHMHMNQDPPIRTQHIGNYINTE